MFKILKGLYWEFLSYFVPEKIEYKVEGKCLKCGKCCRYMYSFDTYTEKEFKIMQFLYPKYKRFYIRGKDIKGNLVFACKYVGDDGLCTVYKKRLKMCRNYPVKKLPFYPKFHEGCGYKVAKKDFKSYLKDK